MTTRRQLQNRPQGKHRPYLVQPVWGGATVLSLSKWMKIEQKKWRKQYEEMLRADPMVDALLNTEAPVA